MEVHVGMRKQQPENHGVGGGGDSTPRDTCRASLKLAPLRRPKFPVPLFVLYFSMVYVLYISHNIGTVRRKSLSHWNLKWIWIWIGVPQKWISFIFVKSKNWEITGKFLRMFFLLVKKKKLLRNISAKTKIVAWYFWENKYVRGNFHKNEYLMTVKNIKFRYGDAWFFVNNYYLNFHNLFWKN